jgi:hypothetical protein
VNLSDRELLELHDLCGAVIDGTMTESQRARLALWLRDSEVARRFYVRALDQSASLHAYAAEQHADAPDRRRVSQPGVALAWWGLGALAAAAAGAVMLWPGLRRTSATEGAAVPYVARITAAKDARWSKSADDLRSGALLRAGRRVELEAGFAEITFDSGARVVLTGAALLEVNSAWDASLRRGTLTATVPREAVGFRITNSAVEVVDLGTEFSMVANANGSADVFVLKGEVEAAPRVADAATILLRENEARRFAASGISDVGDRGRWIAQLTQPLALERFAPATRYVHWSFDDGPAGVFPAEAVGKPPVDSAARLSATDAATLAASSTPGQRGRALHFDGRVYATANFPGISGNLPRTVAFWVKVPEDAKTDAWMVSWGTEVKKLSSRPVQISWNRRPGEGPFGALRTDFGGGYAIGSQDLRDGRWHHVAVCFAADGPPGAPVQVKQYIDGRLESSTIVLTPGKTGSSPVVGPAARRDVVWLGCRLTGKQPERFRGELDELFIADRGLEPGEIVALMRDNQPPVAGLAHHGPPAGIAK